MQLIHLAVAATVTVSIAGASYAALKPEDVEKRARVVAAQANCRAVEAAIVAYVGETGTAPTSVTQLTRYVDGEITAYRIVKGRAAGPGC